MKRLTIIVIAVLFCGSAYAQENNAGLNKNNYEVFLEMYGSGLEVVSDYMAEYGRDALVKVRINGNEESVRFMTGIVKQKFGAYRFLYSDSPDSNFYTLNIIMTEPVLRYPSVTGGSIFGDDYLNRYFRSSFNIKFLNSKGELLKEKSFSKEYSDRINMIYLEQAERSPYSFTKAAVPEKPFLSKILVPAAVVAVSAITIVLFFAIRSK